MQRRRRFVPSRLPRTHIARSFYIAEIVHDRRSHPLVFHCLVRHKKSGEIVRWHQARTLEEAERAAQEYLADLAGDNVRSQHAGRSWLG